MTVREAIDKATHQLSGPLPGRAITIEAVVNLVMEWAELDDELQAEIAAGGMIELHRKGIN